MGEHEEVQKLAESLKGSGLAASMMDAINKAKDILGYSNKGVKIKVEEPKPEQKSKVDEIIKEVDEEIGQKKEIMEPVQEQADQTERAKGSEKPLSNFDMSETPHNDKKDVFNNPSFNIAESNMTVNDLASSDKIVTNDEKVLEKEREYNQSEETQQNIVMTNDEIKQENNENSSQNLEDNEINVQEQSDEIDEEKEEEEGEESSREEEISEKQSFSDDAQKSPISDKPQLTEEEKEMTDLTKLFNPNK